MFDKNVFINEKIAEKNSEIMDMYFTLNKKLDNFMDCVDINFVMPNFSNGLHKIAHQAPLDADRYRDFNALYSFRTKYNSIEGQYIEFNSPIDGVVHILNYLEDIDNALAEAKEISKKEQNYDYSKFIEDEYIYLRKYKKQFILLYDKLDEYVKQGNTLQDFDHRCPSFFIFGE